MALITALRKNLKRHFDAARMRATTFGLKVLLPYFDGGVTLFIDQSKQQTHYGLPESSFATSDNRSIPIYPHYRYTVKAPTPTRALATLAALEENGLLNDDERQRLVAMRGTRTVTEPLENQILLARAVAGRIPDRFLAGWDYDPKGPVLRQLSDDVFRIVGKFEASHRRMFGIFRAAQIFDLKPNASVLEIGFITGGHSIFAFERLGFKAHGIDNFYGGISGKNSQWNENMRLLDSRADFRAGDITEQTSFDAASMDLIFSISVLEHIQNVPAAVAEMYRLLKPGGAIVHNYAPFFCVDGGHVLGIGDAPWGHVRMSQSDFVRYARMHRPFEADAVEEWFAGALQFDMPQWRMQRLVAKAGFRIVAWLAKPSGKRFMKDLTPAIIADCFAATPNIGLEDLVSRSVTFVAIKDA